MPCVGELLQIDGSQHAWLEGRGEMGQANRYLTEHFIDDQNRRFVVEPASDHNAHRSAGRFDLDPILSHQETRTVRNDYTCSYHNTRYQIAREGEGRGAQG